MVGELSQRSLTQATYMVRNCRERYHCLTLSSLLSSTCAAKPKTIAHTFDMSETAIFLADRDDGLGDIRAVLKEEMGKHHAEMVNKMLLADTDDRSRQQLRVLGPNYWQATQQWAVAQLTSTQTETWTSTRIDRSVLTIGLTQKLTADSNGADRTLSLDHLDTLFQQVWERGGNPKVMLTGYDTLMRLQQLLQSQQRFMEEKRVTPTYNGVKGVPGMEAGFIVATYNGVPIIPTKEMDWTTES